MSWIYMSAVEWRGRCRYEDDICGLELQWHCSCWRLQCCQRSLRQEAAFLRPPRWLQHCQRDSARWPHYVRRPDTELVFTSFQFLCVSECPDDGFLTKWPLLKCLIKICWYALTLDSETGHCRGCQSRFCFIFIFGCLRWHCHWQGIGLGQWDDMPAVDGSSMVAYRFAASQAISTYTYIVADLCPSIDGSAVRTSLVTSSG